MALADIIAAVDVLKRVKADIDNVQTAKDHAQQQKDEAIAQLQFLTSQIAMLQTDLVNAKAALKALL